MTSPNLPGDRGQQRRPPRKPSFMLLLMLGVMAFFLYSQYQKAKLNAEADRDPAMPGQAEAGMPGESHPGTVTIPDFSNDDKDSHASPSEANANADRRNWSIDTDIPTTVLENQTEVVLGSGGIGPVKTQSGDWTLEVGDSKRPGVGSSAKSQPKTTRKGDWEVSEVDIEK